MIAFAKKTCISALADFSHSLMTHLGHVCLDLIVLILRRKCK